MKRRLFARKPSPAMVVALVALCSSLTGGAIAATLITGEDVKNGTIGTKDITNGGVTRKDLKKNAVNTKKVANGTLLSTDFKAGQLPAGPVGPQGPRGADGADGANGADGADGTGRAYAYVTPGTPPTITRGTGFTAVSHPGPGEKAYCLTAPGFDPATDVALTSVDFNATATSGTNTIVTWGTPNDCANGPGVWEVRTTDAGAAIDGVAFVIAIL